MDAKPLSQQEFYRELVNRFFHTNSYFYHCIKNELDAVLRELQGANNHEYLLLGNLFDNLVSAHDTVAELGRLTAIKGFSEFGEKLTQGIQFLHDIDLDSERMKIEIESLAHSMFNSVLLAFQDKDSLQQLRNMLGADFRDEPASDLQEDRDRPDEEFQLSAGLMAEAQEYGSDQPLFEDRAGVFSDEESSRVNEIEETSFDPISEDDPTEDNENGQDERFRDLALENDDPALTNEVGSNDLFSDDHIDLDVELLLEDDLKVYDDIGMPPEPMPALEDTSPQFPERCEPEAEHTSEPPVKHETDDAAPAPRNSEPDRKPRLHEPEVVVKYFCQEVRDHLAELDEVLAKLKSEPTQADLWEKSDAIMDSIVMTSVIYGFEAFEQITAKAKKLIARTRSDEESGYDRAVVIVTKTRQVLNYFLANNPERIESKLVKQFTTKLTTPLVPSEPTGRALPAIHAREGRIPGTERDGETETGNKRTEVQGLKLPGEDDAEVMNLIAEITREKEEKNSASKRESKENRLGTRPGETLEDNEFVDKRPSPPVNTSKSQAHMTIYRRGAEVYLNAMEEALIALDANGQNKTALDDLEVAANALYGLTLKLNLEEIGRFPDLLLTLLRDVLATNYSFSSHELALMKHVTQYFRNLQSVEQTKERQFMQMLTSLKDLDARVKNYVRSSQ